MLNKDFDSASVGFSSDGTLQLPDLHGDETLTKAVRALVANEPELSSQVVKAWLTEDDSSKTKNNSQQLSMLIS